jgi:hypothetical protein
MVWIAELTADSTLEKEHTAHETAACRVEELSVFFRRYAFAASSSG